MEPALMNEMLKGAISGGSEGTASILILGAFESGKFFLRKIRDHPEKAQKKAIERVTDLAERTSLRINALEHKFGSLETQAEAKISDPDFIFLFHNACIAAARTEGQEYHELLARLITDRFTAEPDSLQALAAHMSCTAIPQLSDSHLKMLGALYIIRRLHAPPYIKELPYDERIDIGTKWFLDEIKHYVPFREIFDCDLAHLIAVSCITFVPQLIHSGFGGSTEPGYWNLSFVLRDKLCSLKEISTLPPPIREPKIEQNQIGRDLLSFWAGSDMRKASLTPAGSFIGATVRDIILERQMDSHFTCI